MNHVDLYHFINSVDMRKYLRDISYRFSISEAAFVVYWSNQATLKEKISAWRDVISSMPDCAFRRRNIEFESYHSFLKSYISLVKRDVELFCADSCEKSVYAYEFRETGDNRWRRNGEVLFSDYQSCAAAIQEERSDNDEITEIRVYKYLLDKQTRSGPSRLSMNRDMEVLEIDSCHEDSWDFDIFHAFEDCCFNFPSPFQRGDIVIRYDTKTEPQHRPFVLSHMTTWDSKERTEKGFCCDWGRLQQGSPEKQDKRVARLLNRGDCTDMQAIGYCVDCESGVVYLDDTMNLVIDLEYYHGPLEGLERQLKLFSCYEKGKASNIPVDAELLVNGCFAIRAEELAKKFAGKAAAQYSTSDLLQLGVSHDI